MGTDPGSGAAASVDPLDVWLSNEQPVWEAIPFDVPCSRCYNLRMLPNPRCPECGLQFSWRDLLRARLSSSWLFEHQWRYRPIRSYFETLWRGLWPWRFWQRVSIHDRVRVGPLFMLLVLAVPLFAVVMREGLLALGAVEFACRLAANYLTGRRPAVPLLGCRIWDGLSELRSLETAVVTCIVVGLVIFASLALLCGLRQTMARCRVRAAHMLRVAAYAAGPASCWTAAWAALLVATAFCLESLLSLHAWATVFDLAVPISILLVPGLHLAAGLKIYLHVPNALLTGVATVLVGVLFAATATAVFL
jgi:hypothetical protein